MKRIILSIVTLPFICSPAFADNRAAVCHLWIKPNKAVVSPHYQPGVDVKGRPVVPADVGQNQAIKIPEHYAIPVKADLLQLLGAVVPAGLDLEAMMGIIEVQPDGRITYNGQDLTDGAQEVCAEYLPKKKAEQKSMDLGKSKPSSKKSEVERPKIEKPKIDDVAEIEKPKVDMPAIDRPKTIMSKDKKVDNILPKPDIIKAGEVPSYQNLQDYKPVENIPSNKAPFIPQEASEPVVEIKEEDIIWGEGN
jgi:hypothetical protein